MHADPNTLPRPKQTDVFRAISDPTRRQILQLLVDQPRPVNEVCESFAVSQPAISQHMRVLREANLVNVNRDGRRRIYHVTPSGLREVLEWVRYFEKFWDHALDRIGDLVEEDRASDV